MYEDVSRVPVMHGDETKSYFKYFNRELPEIPQWKMDILKDPVKDPKLALSIHDRNKLFEPGDLPTEIGIYYPEEGGAVIHNQQFFPDATGEMLEWWYAWFPGFFAVMDLFIHPRERFQLQEFTSFGMSRADANCGHFSGLAMR